MVCLHLSAEPQAGQTLLQNFTVCSFGLLTRRKEVQT